MKRIIVCCDGTWKRLDEEHPTNVARTACAVLPRALDGTTQIVIHLDGVGTGRGTGEASRLLDKYLGGALGGGLDANVADAYRMLVFNYEPGDEVYLFGYSRGAFTARSLAGLIRKAGILSRGNARRIGEALALYRDRDKAKGPTMEPSMRFRATYSPDVYLGPEDLAWRKKTFPDRDWSRAQRLRIRYIGVWDTVGALGVPGFFATSPLLNRRYQFHDTELSSHVEAARHAVATDERRRTFEPTLWTNLPTLNGGGKGDGLAYQQRWFAGVHGAIGGGGAEQGLASLALLWVLEGAEAFGLELDPEAKTSVAKARNPFAPVAAAAARLPALRWVQDRLGADRAGPEAGDRDALSDPLIARWNADRSYRPKALDRVRQLLDRLAGVPTALSRPPAAATPGDGTADPPLIA